MLLAKVILQDVLHALDFVMCMFEKVLRSTLQSMLTPLEICAVIAVVDVSEGTNWYQIVLAVTSLVLAVCDWHVPQVISHHDFICRFLSATCMQTLFPYSPTLTCLAFLWPTFGKRAQSISVSTSTPDSEVDASVYVAASAGDEISLDDVIAKLKVPFNEDTRGTQLLAAAITLRDSRGRDRKAALRKMASAWGVTVNEKIEGKYKARLNSALAEDIQASVCKAALDWESWAQPSQGSDTRSVPRPDAEPTRPDAELV